MRGRKKSQPAEENEFFVLVCIEADFFFFFGLKNAFSDLTCIFGPKMNFEIFGLKNSFFCPKIHLYRCEKCIFQRKKGKGKQIRIGAKNAFFIGYENLFIGPKIHFS